MTSFEYNNSPLDDCSILAKRGKLASPPFLSVKPDHWENNLAHSRAMHYDGQTYVGCSACIIYHFKSIGSISLREFSFLNSASRVISDLSWFKNNLLIFDGDKGSTRSKASGDICG